MKRFLIGLGVGFVVLVSVVGGAVGDRIWGYKPLDQWWPRSNAPVVSRERVRVVKEENMVVEVVEEVSPSVVTIGIKKTQQVISPESQFFDPFDFFGFGGRPSPQVEEREIEQDIGSGFIVSQDGLIVTNKHVVADNEADYSVITSENQEFQVENIYRDPVNDLAILKVGDGSFQPVEMGNSDELKVGQTVIAIGTALGEFRSTVTTGVVSGLGRGIQAGSGLGGQVENLDNVIQTDAAINPGNSGGPLLNSAGQVVGVNVATTRGAENIGFALPINLVKSALKEFEETGRFSRAFLGVRYKMIDQETALLNEVPQGAYLVEVLEGSPADQAGLQNGDIVVKIDGQALKDVQGGLAEVVNQKRVGQTVPVEYWREGQSQTVSVTFQESNL